MHQWQTRGLTVGCRVVEGPAGGAEFLAAKLAELREQGPLLMEYLAGIPREKREINDFLVDLNRDLQQHIGYLIRMEPGVQTCEQTLERAKGSCRDTAWLLVQILRHLGLAARFVSGYLVQLAPDQKSLDGPSGPEEDFTDLHAWAEVFLPGAGWVGLDPTSGLFAGEGHIPLACTPDPIDAAPITGSSEKAEVEFRFHNEVRRIHEDPRVTKPYTEEQWGEIMTLGEQVEQDLVISRALVDLYSDDILARELAFRGGTALHKLFRGKRLDGPQRADRHENRCPDGTVSGVDDTGSCAGFLARGDYGEVKHGVNSFRFHHYIINIASP